MELTTSYQKLDEKYLGNSYGDLYIRIYAKWSEQDVANNQTKVQYQARAYFSGNYILDQQSSGNVKGTSASQVNFSKSSNYSKGETTLGTTEAWVTHNSDGTMSISASAYLSFPNWGWSGTASGTATLPNLHKPPVINTATMVETNSVLTALNVPNTTIVRYLSIKTITLNATIYDGATPTYRLRHLNSDYAIPSSTTYQDSNVFTNVDYRTHDVAIGDGKANLIQDIKDNYNGSATDWVYVNIDGAAQKPNGIAYTKPTIERTNTSIKRKSGGGTTLTDNKAVLNFKGTFYKGNDVIGNNNNIQQIGYKLWEKGTSEPSSYTPLTPTISGGIVTISNLELTNLPYTKTYNYKIILKDRYGYQDAITDGTLPTGVSVWTEYKDRVDFEKITIKNKTEVLPSNNILVNKTTGLDITFGETNVDKFTFIVIGHDNGTNNMTITVGGFYKNSLSDSSYSRILGSKTITRKSQYVYHIDATQWGWYYIITPPGIIATLSIPN